MKKALICGISGQDGAYLAELLLKKGYQVWGTSRDAQVTNFSNLTALGIKNQVQLLSMAQSDFRSVLNALTKASPDEVYFLSGQSSVGLSFDQPAESIDSTVYGVLNLLEAIRFLDKKIKLYNASSSECFGEVPLETPSDELSPFRPRSPYGVAKSSAHWLVANYRESYNLFCCNGILFNHESPLRPERFVTKKIVSTACRIKLGSGERLHLGSLNIYRDWGWAPDFVDAMWRILQIDNPGDYVVATGKSHSLEDFVNEVFLALELPWQAYVDCDASLLRPSEIVSSAGNPSKANKILSWKSETNFSELIERLVFHELNKRPKSN
jgi:GDPmannose 4,6-dehydratase